MRVLVTGATGFLGRRVVPALLERGMDVCCLVHTPGRDEVFGDARVDVCYGDVTDVAALKAAMYHMDAVVHLAAIIRPTRKASFASVNVRGTQNIASVARERGVRQLVYVSVIGANSETRRPFLRSRLLAEQEVRKSGLPYTIVRFPPLFGEGDELVNAVCMLSLVFPVIPLPGSGKQNIQPMSVEDAAKCVALTIGNQEMLERIVEIAGPDAFSVRDVVNLVCATKGLRRVLLPVPMAVSWRILAGFQALGLRIPVTSHHLELLAVDHKVEPGALETFLGTGPRHLWDGITHVHGMSRWDALRGLLSKMPSHIRDH